MALLPPLRNRFRDDCARPGNASSIMPFQPPSIMRGESRRITFD
jgi:hypothetical protein